MLSGPSSHGGEGHIGRPENWHILVDGHAHLYPCFDLALFLSAAQRSFQAARGFTEPRDNWAGCLVLMETDMCVPWSKLQESAEKMKRCEGFQMQLTTEPNSVAVKAEDGTRMFLIAGQQIATCDGIEVLALFGRGQKLKEGSDACRTIAAVRANESLPLLPWGFGKWWLRRRHILERVLRKESPRGLYIGDSAPRPTLLPRSPVFELAERLGVHDLPGTDPLPLRSHGTKAGRLGFALTGPFDERRPAASIQTLLSGAKNQPGKFGVHDPLPRTILSQVLLRVSRGTRALPR